MKKKLVLALLVSMMTLSACGGNKETAMEENKKDAQEKVVEDENMDDEDNEDNVEDDQTDDASSDPEAHFDGSDYEEMGDGTPYLSSPSGNSLDGEEVFIYRKDNDLLKTIGVGGKDFNGSLITYIYIDGDLSTKEQMGEMCEYTLDLAAGEKPFEIGKHKVEFVQFEDNDPEKPVITYKKAEYEIKKM